MNPPKLGSLCQPPWEPSSTICELNVPVSLKKGKIEKRSRFNQVVTVQDPIPNTHDSQPWNQLLYTFNFSAGQSITFRELKPSKPARCLWMGCSKETNVGPRPSVPRKEKMAFAELQNHPGRRLWHVNTYLHYLPMKLHFFCLLRINHCCSVFQVFSILTIFRSWIWWWEYIITSDVQPAWWDSWQMPEIYKKTTEISFTFEFHFQVSESSEFCLSLVLAANEMVRVAAWWCFPCPCQATPTDVTRHWSTRPADHLSDMSQGWSPQTTSSLHDRLCS